ncbi:OmpA family protein [Oceanispirochaeta sp. M1]|uniref:OmpA family protein n=2 Tax=unclassified Oceanispirochaeta TaxID=2635722 RepID=UPI0013143FEB|nr:OmpA family protein [Oceanispirochaeta sp. M1]MBF9016032.1 OmpA family protein [Oceanispirochaeta sp. M2]
MKVIRFSVFSIMILVSGILTADEQEIAFSHTEGQVLHADSLVDETVYIDGYLSHQAEIDEFSVSTVRSVSDEGIAVLDSSFRTVERVDGIPGTLEWISSETVRIERDSSGLMSVPEDASRPVLRNVPRFPDYPVKPGDYWSLPAEEVHIFRIRKSLYGPYRGQVQVLYNYLENLEIEGQTYARISIQYNIYLPVRSANEPIKLITGQSFQELLWDIENGKPELKTEDFEFMMVMEDGRTQEFVGKSRTTYRLNETLNSTGAAESLKSELKTVPGIFIEQIDDGVMLSVIETDHILFEAESAIVSEDQRYRLEKLARSLEAYTDRDILISGHTADYGTFEGRKYLSRNRAAAVADLLFPGGREGTGKLFLRGAGNTEPLGSDKEDRRVEILILD